MEFVKTSQRYQVAKECPCGKSNRDGKFSPMVGYTDKGKCHSCNKLFLPEKEKSNRISLPANMYNEPCELRKALYKYFAIDKVDAVFKTFKIGYYKGFTVFPQIDLNNEVRSGKMIKYNGLKRDKEVPPKWLHKVLDVPNFTLEQCFFGLHNLHSEQINIVESEKTAVIATLEYGGCWLATGGKSNLATMAKYLPTSKRVVLFPDNDDAFDIWKEYGEIDFIYTMKVKDKAKGFDLADLIMEKYEKPKLTLDQQWQQEFKDLEEHFKGKI